MKVLNDGPQSFVAVFYKSQMGALQKPPGGITKKPRLQPRLVATRISSVVRV
jgi:hypothetical protein